VFLAAATGGTFAAAYPRVNNTPITDVNAADVRAHGNNFAKYFMPEHQTGAPYFKLLVIAQIKLTIVQMNI
jgi:hypothetical protein